MLGRHLLFLGLTLDGEEKSLSSLGEGYWLHAKQEIWAGTQSGEVGEGVCYGGTYQSITQHPGSRNDYICFFCVFFPFSFPLGTGNFNLFFLLNSNTDFYYFWSTQTQLQECFSTFSSHLQEGIIIIIICLLELALLRIKTGKHENLDV